MRSLSSGQVTVPQRRFATALIAVASFEFASCASEESTRSELPIGMTTAGAGPSAAGSFAGMNAAGNGVGAGGPSIGVAGTGFAGRSMGAAGSFGGSVGAGSSATAGMSAAGMGAAGRTATAGMGAAAGSGGGAGSSGAVGPGAAGASGMPMGGTGGAMMAAGSGAPEPRMDLGEGDGRDVITIGDSWMSLLVTGIQQSLVRESGQPYRTYGVLATRLLNDQIPDQYASAKRIDPDIKTVVMTGGGNDIIQVPGLRDDCERDGPLCDREMPKILDRLTQLWDEMSEDGVQDVIYVQYSTPDRKDVDWALPNGDGIEKRCDEVPEPLRCHRLPTDSLVRGDIPDGTHPSAAGYDRIAAAVYELMVEEGMRR